MTDKIIEIMFIILLGVATILLILSTIYISYVLFFKPCECETSYVPTLSNHKLICVEESNLGGKNELQK